MSKHSHRPKTREDYEYDALQPMLKKLPPNEIISQKYMPDTEAHMKLVYLVDHSGATATSGATISTSSLPKSKTMSFKPTPLISISWTF